MHVMLLIVCYGEQKSYLRVTLGLAFHSRPRPGFSGTHTQQRGGLWLVQVTVCCQLHTVVILGHVCPIPLQSFSSAHSHFTLPMSGFSSSLFLYSFAPAHYLCLIKWVSHLTLRSLPIYISLSMWPHLHVVTCPHSAFSLHGGNCHFSMFSKSVS